MLWLSFIALQAIEPADPSANWLASPERCARPPENKEEVVVCGRRDGQSPYRIGPQPSAPPALPDAEFKISDNVKAGAKAEQGEVGGIPTNRAMVTLKIKF